MFNFRCLVIILLAFICKLSLAGEMSSHKAKTCNNDTISLPCAHNSWGFGAKLLYLQPAFSEVTGERSYSLSNGAKASVGQGSVWDWGGMFEGSYHFNSGNDMNINWNHIGSSNTSSRSSDGTFLATQLGLSNTTGNVLISSTSLSVSPTWDAFNIEFGQLIDYGKNRTIRVHAGIDYSRIDLNTTLNINALNIPTGGGNDISLDRVYSSRISYNGLGPRVGADMSYAWGDGLGIYATGATSLLMGSGKYSSYDNVSFVTVSGANTIVVPTLEAKLGITYSFNLVGAMTLDTGWMWVNYFNPLSVVNPGITNAPGSNNFGLAGPYLGFKWLGDITKQS